LNAVRLMFLAFSAGPYWLDGFDNTIEDASIDSEDDSEEEEEEEEAEDEEEEEEVDDVGGPNNPIHI